MKSKKQKGKLIRVSDETHGRLCELQAKKISMNKKRVTMNHVIIDLLDLRVSFLEE